MVGLLCTLAYSKLCYVAFLHKLLPLSSYDIYLLIFIYFCDDGGCVACNADGDIDGDVQFEGDVVLGKRNIFLILLLDCCFCVYFIIVLFYLFFTLLALHLLFILSIAPYSTLQRVLVVLQHVMYLVTIYRFFREDELLFDNVK